jgi:spore maturation protein SpmB
VAVAWVQRIRLWQGPHPGLSAASAALMAALYLGLRGLPPKAMADAIGLIGSGVIFGVIVLFVAVGAWRRINVYEVFVEGAKEGFGVAVTIIPYLIAILAAISVFRSTGCMDVLMTGIAAVVGALGLDTDFVPALPVGLMKTLSGSGARGLMIDVMKTYGVDSFQGRLAAIIQGSTETTFYVLAVYFGSVNIRNTRYALACGLFADAVGWSAPSSSATRSITRSHPTLHSFTLARANRSRSAGVVQACTCTPPPRTVAARGPWPPPSPPRCWPAA